MKKILLGVSLIVLAMFGKAQNGLENITVEKYYISTSADAAGSVGHGTLPVGSITYRIYADMLPGYKFQMAYGNANHNLIMTTSTTFYNSTDYGATTPGFSKTNAAKWTTMLDSWLSVGGACSGNLGVMKSEDNGVNNVVNAQGLLANTAALMGIPLTTQDGLIAGTPESVTFVGFTTQADVFGDGTANGSSFTLNNQAWSSLNGSTGATANNRVLIAQITTDGIFHYELNIQIGTPTGGVQVYVSSSPQTPNGNGQNEITIPSLTGTLNVAPSVSITAPADNTHSITGDVVALAATAADADGTVTQVEFFVDGVSKGIDNTAPYTVNYTGVTGTHTLTAVATDNDGLTKTSDPITLIVAPNQAPTISITSPSNGANFITGAVVAIAATAADSDGTVTSVEFFVDGASVGVDNSAPYTANYTSVLGPHTLTAKATDDRSAQTTSSTISISVLNNVPPTVSLTAPSNGSSVTAPTAVTINATAADADGSVTKVEFYVNGTLIGEDLSAPYSFVWTSVVGTANITAKATDNGGAFTTSSTVTISVLDPFALPYKVGSVSSSCAASTFTLPFIAVDSVHNVIGYDMVLNYNINKITPTGIVTKVGDLVNANYFDITKYINPVAGTINITLSLNGSAPVGTYFHGVGNLFTISFNKAGGFNNVDTATVSVTGLQESYITGVSTKLAEAGKYISYKDNIFNGTLQFWNAYDPIQYNVANPNQYLITNIYGTNGACVASPTAVQPNTSGVFNYDINNGQFISIKRDILPTVDMMSVLNAGTDVFLAKKVVTSNPTFIPNVYQMIAMDVNMDGVVSAGDVSQLSQRIVLAIPEFKQAWNYSVGGVSDGRPSKDWEFVDLTTVTNNAAYQISTTYPANDGVGFSKSHVPSVAFCLEPPVLDYNTCPQITNETYEGILLGDVDGSYKNIAADGLLKEGLQLTTDTVMFDLAHAIYSGGDVSVPVSMITNTVVNGIDFATKYNENMLTYDSTFDQTGYLDAYSYFNTNDRTIRFSATNISGGNIQAGVTLVLVRFHNLDGTMIPAYLDSVRAYINGSPAIIKLTSPTVGIATNKAERNVTVYPNPTTNILNVIVSEDSKLEMLDLNGKVVVAETNVNAKQHQVIDVTSLANGVYMLKVYNDKYVKMQKVVINR